MKNSKRITLMGIMLKKEKKHWNRAFDVYKKFGNIVVGIIFGTLVNFIMTLVHYALALMSFLHNSVLYIFARNYFKNNLQIMARKFK